MSLACNMTKGPEKGRQMSHTRGAGSGKAMRHPPDRFSGDSVQPDAGSAGDWEGAAPRKPPKNVRDLKFYRVITG